MRSGDPADNNHSWQTFNTLIDEMGGMKMKKQMIVLWFTAVAISGMAQETNPLARPSQDNSRKSVEKTHPRSQWTEQQREEHQERKYQFMDKVLSEIGVGGADRVEIRMLQEIHRQKMKANMKRSIAARKKLSELQEKGAAEEEIGGAIQEIADAMAEQLWVLVRNRMEMEKILGKEKYALLMQNARKQFQKHGRSGGASVPPRPGLPPMPGEGRGVKQPPPPPVQPPMPPTL